MKFWSKWKISKEAWLLCKRLWSREHYIIGNDRNAWMFVKSYRSKRGLKTELQPETNAAVSWIKYNTTFVGFCKSRKGNPFLILLCSYVLAIHVNDVSKYFNKRLLSLYCLYKYEKIFWMKSLLKQKWLNHIFW